MQKIKEKLITDREVYLSEIENVSNNRFMSEKEKQLKIKELLKIINKKKDE